MTETSGYSDDWVIEDTEKADALTYAAAIGSALKYGKVSAWVHWSGSELNTNFQSEYSIMDGLKAGNRYAVSKNYYMFIRPGDVMLDANSSDSKVLSTAFLNSGNHKTIVLVNGEDVDKIVTVNGLDEVSEYAYYISTEAKGNNCSYVGRVPQNDIRLPARSVITLTTKSTDDLLSDGGGAPVISEPPAGGENTPEATPEATPEVTPEITPDVTAPVVTSEVTVEPTDDTAKKPGKPKIKSVKNNSKKAVLVKLKKVSGAKGYQYLISTKKKFPAGSATKKKVTKKVKFKFKKLKKGKNYFVKARAYVLDGKQKVYGKYSSISVVKVKK